MTHLLAGMIAAAMSVPVPSAQQPPPWQDWKFAQPILVPNPARNSLARFALPKSVYSQARSDLADLRVIDSTSAQQPYAVDQAVGNAEVTWQAAALSEQGFVPGHYSQAVADAGTSGEMHDVLAVDTSADQFSDWVEVAASDDERTWRIVRQRAPIFRFRSDGFEGSLNVSFARTRSRWLRVRVLNPSTPFPIEGCSVADVVATAPELVAVASEIRPDPKSAKSIRKQTRLTVDLGGKDVPVSEVRFDARDASFHRAVAVLASEDGENWNDVFNCEIYRDDQGGASLSFSFPEGRGRFWRLVVYDRDDMPLQELRASLYATPRYVAFRARPGSHYRLIFGNPQATAPTYDFSASTSAEERARAELATLGQYGAAMNPVAPIVARPWSETHAGVVWAALFLAVIVLAWVALRALR